ncbi:MAG: hypothetical protein ACRD8O_06050 [Bryobacteraceae bacterium]
MTQPTYLLLGALLLGASGFANYRGWSFLNTNERKNLPKSLRDNPGAYRSHYGYFPRYIGGK